VSDTILVTGATGFLGRHLVGCLVEAGYAVRALVRPASDTHFLRSVGIEVASGDVRDAASVNAALAGCRWAVHAAGLFRFWGDARDFRSTNVDGTRCVIEAALRHGLEKLVHVSSLAVVGIPPAGRVIDETVACAPADDYQRSKLDAESLVREAQRTTRLPIVILRPGAFYGPWGRYAFNRLFFEDPLRGLRIQVHNGRRLTFPVYVPDVARAILAVLRSDRPGQIYNVAGEPITHRQVNCTVSRLAGILPWRVNVPAGVMVVLASLMTRWAWRTGREPYYSLNLAAYVFHDWPVSSVRAQAELGFAPTPFEDGARQTLEWYWNAGILRPPVGWPLQCLARFAGPPGAPSPP
jgi:dihydroflavonol-4-reductase